MKKYIYGLLAILFFCFFISRPVYARDLANTSPSVPTGLTASSIINKQVTLITKGQLSESIKGLKASSASSNTINLTWKAAEGATSYNIYRSSTSKGIFTLVGTSATESYLDEGLTASTKYYYKVSAVYGNGEGAQSNIVSASTKGILPGTVTDVSVSSVGTNQVILTWSSVDDAKSYKIYRSVSSTGPFKYVGTCKTTVYSNKGLMANTTYYYYVTAANKNGEGIQSSVVTVVTKGEVPGKVKGLQAVSNNGNVVDLTWKAVDGAVSYNIYRSVNKAGAFTSIIGTSTTESYLNEGLTPNTKYYYKVSAVNENGEGKQSNTAAVTTKKDSLSAQSNYTALGDSIAYGVGASTGKGYVDLFYNYLKGLPENTDMELDNLAVSGYTSSDLLAQLQSSNVQQKISKSKVVTICIGSNNLLGPTIAAAAKAFGLNPNDSDFVAELKAKLSDPANLAILASLMNSEDFSKSMTNGVTQFNSDWSKIVAEIRTLAPDAQVYVMTLYNPISEDNIALYNLAFNLFDSYIKQINTAIMNSGNSCKVVDVYSKFLNNQGDLLTGMSSLDPHPTDKGHELIYQAHLSAGVTGVTEVTEVAA